MLLVDSPLRAGMISWCRMELPNMRRLRKGKNSTTDSEVFSVEQDVTVWVNDHSYLLSATLSILEIGRISKYFLWNNSSFCLHLLLCDDSLTL